MPDKSHAAQREGARLAAGEEGHDHAAEKAKIDRKADRILDK